MAGGIHTKLILSRQVKKLIGIVLAACLIIMTLFNVVGYFLNCRYISVAAAVEQAGKYEVRNELLMRAMDYVGACSPEAAVQVWVEGMKHRNGAIQYSVMGPELKKEYLTRLEQYNPYWVTGMSSPWVDSCQITDKTQTESMQYVFQLSFSTMTSGGPAETYHAEVTVNRQDDFWQITKIEADQGLYPYMGYLS